MQQHELLYCAELCSTEHDAPILDEMLSALEIDHSSVIDVDAHTVQFLIVCFDRQQAQEFADLIEEELPQWTTMLENPTPEVQVIEVKKENWAEAWKEFFKPFRASQRLIVKPSWEYVETTPEDLVLEIDPGMSFGTGHHGTTKAVLQFMDQLQLKLGSVPFLDAGSGSGILSLAAVKLGFQPIEAFDYDPEAVKCTKENLANAGYTQAKVHCADVSTFIPSQPVRIAAVNILATVLLDNISHIASFLDRTLGVPSYLILSGILNEQYSLVKERYQALGLEELESITINEWTSGLFVCRNFDE